MAKVINLRTIRKQRARDDARAEGTAKAMRHGQSKAERTLLEQERAMSARKLDGHRRDPDTGDE
ncbi:MAG: DUF4169 family protein [Paracoccaceae bacterium]